MTDFSVDLHLDELTSLVKKLGEYEYRFGITSEQMFSSDIKVSSFEVKLPFRDIVVEWETYYNEYISKHNQILLIINLLANKNFSQTQFHENSIQLPTTSKLTNQLKINKLPIVSDETDQLYYTPEKDKCNLTEIKLPFAMVKEPMLRNGKTTQYAYRLGGFGSILKKVKDDSLSVTYSVLINLKWQLDDPVFNLTTIFDLLKIKNGKTLSIPESISYQGHEYLSSNVSYLLQAEQEFWESVTEEIDDFFRCKDNEAVSSNHHLSIFIDETKVIEKNYIVKYPSPTQNYIGEEKNNLVKLQIPVEATKFEISENVYWLEEAGNPIEFEWLVDPQGRFGCLGSKLYPVTQARANFFAHRFNSRKSYEMNTPEHDLGSIALNNVKASLEKLSGVTAWDSCHRSDADIKLKWDLFLKINSTVYPLQIKSSFGKAQKALSEYEEAKLPFIPLIIWVNPSKSEDSARKLVQDLALRFSKILNTPVCSNKDVEIFFLNEEGNATSHFISTNHIKLPILSNHNTTWETLPSIENIGTQKKAHKQYKDKLKLEAQIGKWDTEAEKIMEAIAVRGTNRLYQAKNHEIFLKEMIEVKKSYLTNNSLMLKERRFPI